MGHTNFSSNKTQWPFTVRPLTPHLGAEIGGVHLSEEMSPYTQNHYFFENIQKMRNAKLKKKVLQLLLSLWNHRPALTLNRT